MLVADGGGGAPAPQPATKAPSSPGSYSPYECGRFGINCQGFAQYVAYQNAHQTTCGLVTCLAGIGNAFAQLGDFGMMIANPFVGIKNMITGNTLSDQYTRWVHSMGVNTSGPDYRRGTFTGQVLIGIGSLAAGPLFAGADAADAALAAEDVFTGLNAVRSDTGAAVAARLNLGDQSFVGTNLARGNAPIKGTFSFFVQHAEGDAFSQALSSGGDYAGQSGTFYVTQAPCGFCVAGISTTARSMGLARLTIETPDGAFGIYTPETGLVREP